MPLILFLKALDAHTSAPSWPHEIQCHVEKQIEIEISKAVNSSKMNGAGGEILGQEHMGERETWDRVTRKICQSVLEMREILNEIDRKARLGQIEFWQLILFELGW